MKTRPSTTVAKPWHLRNTAIRSLSAAVLLVLALSVGYLGGAGFQLAVWAVGSTMMWEWLRLRAPDGRDVLRSHRLALVAFGVVAIASLCGAAWVQDFDSADGPRWVVWQLVVVVILGALLAAFRQRWGAIGLAYTVLLPIFAIKLRAHSEAYAIWLLAASVAIWVADTTAYFVGRTLKGPALCPSISPSKTWSGAISGLTCGTLAGMGILFQSEHVTLPADGLAMAGLTVISVFGDLFESAAKRRCGRKDSGFLIPGHGGVLDRLDGFVFSLPAVYLYLVCLR